MVDANGYLTPLGFYIILGVSFIIGTIIGKIIEHKQKKKLEKLLEILFENKREEEKL